VYQIKSEQFQGPMDLLLQLIEAEELDITSISLSKITDEYVSYLKDIEEKRPEDFADFLYVAARLLYLKSRTLLPYLRAEEEQGVIPLELQLKIYREFYEASKKIQNIISRKNFSYFREKPLPEKGVFVPPKNVSVNKLSKIFKEIIAFLEPIIAIPKTTLKKIVSIKEKINQIITLVQKSITLNFSEIVKGAKSKTEIVVSFLALLQLVKDKVVDVEQKKLFHDITLKKL
jgi:segregation and condensation protein A